jgi:hypothetical protein
MDKVNDIVTDSQVELAWGNANFGDVSPRDVIANTLLKCAVGYATGRTARVICEELGLVTGDWQLSQRGKAYLFAAYSRGLSV